MRKFLILLLPMLIILGANKPVNVKAASRGERAQTPSQLIALINAYRAEFGLPAYTQNNILMGTAQGQADYQASIESVTHAGPDGSRPRERAYSAGYGGGEVVFISEIIYGSTSAGPETAVSWWKTSQIHNDTMLASTYQEIGAGVASANGRNYYTAVTGYVAGGAYVPPEKTAVPGETEEAQTVFIIIPVVVATPQADGKILHIIRSGQTLWTVSAVYEVELAEVLRLNNLPENAVIFPGDQILIGQAKATARPTASPTALEASATAIPSLTATKQAAVIGEDEAESTGKIKEEAQEDVNEAQVDNASVRLTLFIAVGSIVAVIFATFFIRGNAEERHEDQEGKPI